MTTIDASGYIHKGKGSRGAGQFAGKMNSAPADTLVTPAEDSAPWIQRTAQLSSDYLELWSDPEARKTVRAVGEQASRRAQLAESTRDPAVLAFLTGDIMGEIGVNVARNPAAPACVLHDIATDRRSSRQYEDRFAAVTRPQTDVATLQLIWSRTADEDVWAPHLQRDMVHAPNATGEILTTLLDHHVAGAGKHPNLPADILAAAAADPSRAHLVIEHPALTDDQLREAITATAAHQYDDEDDIWAVTVAAGAARHPNASADTVARLTGHPDAHVRKTARDRQSGDRITRGRAAAEQEMREAGGSEDDIRKAGDAAAQMALEGAETGKP